MVLQPEQLFNFMEAAWRNGVLDELLPLVGQSLEKLKAKTGLTMDDLLNMLDGAQPASIEKFNKVLNLTPPLMKLASNDLLMGMLAKALRLQPVRSLTVWGMEKYFGYYVAKTDGTLVPLTAKLRGLAKKADDNGLVTAGRTAGS